MLVDWTAPFADTELHIAPAATIQAEFKAYAGLYREALISGSPAYEFLCLYKIAEALWKRWRYCERAFLTSRICGRTLGVWYPPGKGIPQGTI